MFANILYKLRKMRQQRSVILMYHQVCQRETDPWELAVRPNHFQAHMEYLKSHFDVVPVAALAQGVSSHKIRQSVAITFDDGFKDNYLNAAPLLDWLEMPATFYVATTALQDGKAYWWDVLQQITLHMKVLPTHLDIPINGERIRFCFRYDHMLTDRLIHQIRAWNYNLPIPNERVELYMLLWYRLKLLSYPQQHAVLQDILRWAGCGEVAAEPDVMNVREMQILGQNPLFSIGAHSVNHAMLSCQDAAHQAYEVKESKLQIERWLGKPVCGFAYPYGNFNEVTQKLLKESGFRYAVSTESKAVTVDDDLFALPRLQVKNWSVYEFASKLNELMHE